MRNFLLEGADPSGGDGGLQERWTCYRQGEATLPLSLQALYNEITA